MPNMISIYRRETNGPESRDGKLEPTNSKQSMCGPEKDDSVSIAIETGNPMLP
jgi:hypothetical protein